MKLKLDENIPQSAAARLAALGYDVDTVLEEQLGTTTPGTGCSEPAVVSARRFTRVAR